jgi:sugar O-acyltransferase (sialic acid O-acetyltransferase NeuD family)
MSARKVVIFGTGDIGELAHFYLMHDSEHEVVAFCSDAEFVKEPSYRGLPLVAFEEVVDRYPPSDFAMFVALSYSKLNEVRAKKYHEAKAKGYTLISYVCSRSVMWGDTEIGDNCFIFENQTIQPFVKIGNNVTMWSGNHIGHGSTIGDHAFLTSHVVVSGHVDIGAYSFLGVNATLRDGITLAERTVVGAGATIVKNTVEGGVYMGVAAQLKSDEGGKIDYFAKTSYKDRETK